MLTVMTSRSSIRGAEPPSDLHEASRPQTARPFSSIPIVCHTKWEADDWEPGRELESRRQVGFRLRRRLANGLRARRQADFAASTAHRVWDLPYGCWQLHEVS